MPNYQPSLHERKLRFLENCAGCGGGDGFSMDGGGASDGGTAEGTMEVEPQRFSKAVKLDAAMNKVRKRKKKVNANGT